MEFDIRQGEKARNDLILLVRTDSYEQITYKDLFAVVKFFYGNEERVYPSPKFRGNKMLLDALFYLRTHTVDETLSKFQLRKKPI